jgi:hypothetical protein
MISPPNKPHSNPWWLRAFAASFIGLLVGSVWLLARQAPAIPVYRGKSLPVWLRTYGWSSSSRLDSRERIEADDAGPAINPPDPQVPALHNAPPI